MDGCLFAQQILEDGVDRITQAVENVCDGLATSHIPWLGGPSFHPEAFQPAISALAAAGILLSPQTCNQKLVERISPAIKTAVQRLLSSPSRGLLHSLLVDYLEALSMGQTLPVVLC